MLRIAAETPNHELCYARVGPLFLGVQRAAVSTEQTRQVMEQLAAHVARDGTARVLVMFAPSSGPTAEQRKIIMEEYADRTGVNDFVRVALLSSSMAVRGVLTALAWFGSGKSKVKAWKPSDWRACLTWLHEGADFDMVAAETGFQEILEHTGYTFSEATR